MTRGGVLAAVAWCVFCWRWFDVGGGLRPAWLEAVPAALLALPAGAAVGAWCWRARRGFLPELGKEDRLALLFVVALAIAFRWPLLWQGAAGYLTADGALSGIVAQQIRDGVAHHVFVPHVPYSGSLKSHLTVPLMALLDPARAFALASLLFYAAYVAALFGLARLALDETGTGDPGPLRSGAVLAGLYAALAPPFVTHYSLSNDGNYVEVLALGTWALWLTAWWLRQPERPSRSLLAVGLLLGLAFWAHILALIPLACVGLVLVLSGQRGWSRLPWLALGCALGYAPGLLWNAANGWQSLLYVVPGAQPVVGMEAPPPMTERLRTLVTDQWPVLMGYDAGYGPGWDGVLRAFAGFATLTALACALSALVAVARRRRLDALAVVVLFALVNQTVALLALPQVPGNPRYLLFLNAPVAVFLVRSLRTGWGRLALGALLAGSALGALGQWPDAARTDARWRALVAGLEERGVRWCYTDFYLATPVNFLADGEVVCSSKLGPTTTEYFFEFRRAVDAAPEAAYVAVNRTAGDKLERRLSRLDVRYERSELMKPVLHGLSRKVDPSELFPDREFPLR